MKQSIIWLASYPKSGNTWTRMFLANYLVNGDHPVPITQVHRFGMGDAITKTYAKENEVKLGAIAQPLRAALTGSKTSPGIYDVLIALGRKESLARIGDQTTP